MNKLFTKVATLCVGLAMAAGVGVAVGASSVSEARAESLNFNASAITGMSSSPAKQTGTYEGFTFEVSNGLLATSGELRVYKNQTLTVSSSIGNITSFTLTVKSSDQSSNGAGGFNGSSGYTSSSNASGTWTGDAQSFTLTASGNQVRIETISITYTPSVEPGVFLGSSSIWLVNEGESKDVAVTTNNFSGTPTIAVSGTPSYVTPTIGEGKVTFAPKAVGSETVRITATSGTQSAYADLPVTVYAKHGLVADDPFNVAEAKQAIDAGGPLEQVYVAGKISQIDTTADKFSGQIVYWISEDGKTDNQFEIYWGKGLENKNFEKLTDIELGASVVNYGNIKKHNSTYEFDSGSYLISYSAPAGTKYTVSFNPGAGTGEMDSVQVLEGNSYTLPACTFTAPEGKLFNGWTINGTDKVTEIQNISANVEVTALWKSIPTGINDTITRELTGVEGTSYAGWTDKHASSSAVYAGNSAGPTSGDNANSIQLRSGTSTGSSIHSGIVTTTSGGNLLGVVVEWSAKCTAGRVIDVYGKSTAYESADDLYASATQGTKLGSINQSNSTSLFDFESCAYVGIRSNEGALNIDSITFIWESSAPVEDKYFVSFWEGETCTSSESYAEGTKVTIPEPTESLIPEGKEFDHWEILEIAAEYAPGDEFVVGKQNVRIDAVYKDVEPVVTDWSNEQKLAFAGVLDGFVPAYFGATTAEPVVNENNVQFFVVGDVTEAAATYFSTGWQENEGYYGQGTENGVVLAYYSLYEGSTFFVFMYQANTPSEGWDSTMMGYFNTVLHGIVPSYDESVKDLAYHPDYEVFYFVAADSDTAETALATLCATWEYYSEGGFYYAYSDDQLGYARGSVYQMAADQFWAVLEYNQTAYDSDMEALFEQYLGFVPPFFSGFPTYVWHEGEFVCEYIIETSQLADQIAAYQDDIVNYYELTDLGSSSGNVFVYNGGTSGTYPATIYSYGAALSDGGALIVELYSMFDQYIGFNIYYQAQPVSIALSGDYKTVFEYGEEFSADGLVVTATMSDSSLLDVTEYAEFSGYNATVSGEQTITVTVGSVKTTYTVTVKEYVPVMTGIEVSKNPTKVEYEVGEEFDPSGIEVKAVYDVGDPKVVDLKDVSFSGFDSATAGEKTVTVSYGDFSTTIKVTVKKAAYTAEQFAEDFLAEIEKVCKGYDGKKNNKTALSNVWTKMSARYNELSSEEKTKIANATPKADGDAIQRMLTFYNYACKKYGLTKFISTQKSSLVINSTETTNNNLPIIVIVASAIAAVTAIGVVIGLKRRKNLLVK